MTITYAMTATVLLVGLTIMLVDAAWKIRKSEHRSVSLALIITSMMYVASDCLWILQYTSDAAAYSQGLFSLLNFVFYVLYITLPFIWFFFAMHFVSDLTKNRRFMLVASIPWAFNLCLVFLTMFGADLLWTIGDAGARYARDPWFAVFTKVDLLYYFVPIGYIFMRLAKGEVEDLRTMLTTLGFTMIPALGVFVYTFWIPVEAIFPFQPCCFFIGVMFAYMVIVGQVYKKAEEDNIRLAEKASSADKISELTESVTSLLNNMPGLTFSKDVDTGVYLACNQAFAEYAHKETPDGVAGLTDFEIFDEATAQHFVDDDKKALSMDEPYVFFEDVPDAAGFQRQFQTTKLKFTDTLGRLCTLGMCVDVTEMMTIKREKDEARLASEAKSAFLSNMSHDIRTPMNAIVGFTTIALQDLSDTQRTQEYLLKIQASSSHLLSLINDVLEMSRIESGKIELNEAPCSLTDIMHDLNP